MTPTDAKSLRAIERRKPYIQGLHTHPTYTSAAHFFLLKEMLQTDEWRFVTDNDGSLRTAIERVFMPEIKAGKAHLFLCLVKSFEKSRIAHRRYRKTLDWLDTWASRRGLSTLPRKQKAIRWLAERVYRRGLLLTGETKSGRQFVKGGRRFLHPAPSVDQGVRWVEALTNVSQLDLHHIAAMLQKFDHKATNVFLQQVRRRLSILERPLVTARGEGKSYIYANFNPRYAHMALTILRCYYNFCMAFKQEGKLLTPAQRLGIASKQYDIYDILYLK